MLNTNINNCCYAGKEKYKKEMKKEYLMATIIILFSLILICFTFYIDIKMISSLISPDLPLSAKMVNPKTYVRDGIVALVMNFVLIKSLLFLFLSLLFDVSDIFKSKEWKEFKQEVKVESFEFMDKIQAIDNISEQEIRVTSYLGDTEKEIIFRMPYSQYKSLQNVDNKLVIYGKTKLLNTDVLPWYRTIFYCNPCIIENIEATA